MPSLRDRGDWRFRRSGLFGRKDNLEGAIPVVLTLQQLERQFVLPGLIYATAMELAPAGAPIKKCEADFVAVVPGKGDGPPQVVIGECKNRLPITRDDVDKLGAVAAALRAAGVDVFVVLSKLTEFSPDEIRFAATLNDQKRSAILLTARELEPPHPYKATARILGMPEPTIGSFMEMADFTHQQYFRSLAPAKVSLNCPDL
jgi:hypothetical protein